jgi:hypothetical protein
MVMEREGARLEAGAHASHLRARHPDRRGTYLGGRHKLGLKVSRMPLSVLDIVFADLGLGVSARA